MPPVRGPLRRSPVSPLALWPVLGMVMMAVLLVWPAPHATAAASLQVTAGSALSTTDGGVTLRIQGPADVMAKAASAGSEAAKVAVRLYGPIALDQVGKSEAGLPKPRLLSVTMSLKTSGSAVATAVTSAAITATALTRPGAYLARVVISSQKGTLAQGDAWFGRVAATGPSVDVACVWPLAQGVHRGADGVFFDRALEAALGVEPAESEESATTSRLFEAGCLRDFRGLRETFPTWRFTIAVEPILLAQLQEMAGGYRRLDAAGHEEEVDSEADAAIAAGEALAAFAKLAASDGVDLVAAPYSAPSMTVLAAQGWDDGADQMQLGKRVVQQALALGGLIDGALSPDLDISTKSLRMFSRASIDHVLVDDGVAADLAEPLAAGGVTARVRDNENERLTLIFADARLRALVAEPWDAGLLCAGLAARLAAAPGTSVVIAPQSTTCVPPLSYLQSVGKALAAAPRLRTCTLSDLIRSHSPGSRTVLLDRSAGSVSNYIGISVLTCVAEAHEAVEALTQVAGSTPSTVQRAQLLLYAAESRWWWLPQASPDAASAGLVYAREAQKLAEQELAKVAITGADGTTSVGRAGCVTLHVDNTAGYALSAKVCVAGTGLVFPDGTQLQVELPPGRTSVSVEIVEAVGHHRLEAQLLAGSRVIAGWSGPLRFVTVITILPWLLGALAAALVVAFVLLRRRKCRRS